MDNITVKEPTTIKEQVRQLREESRSIREIARTLGVTKHTVEKAVKELSADSVRAYSRTAAPECRTHRQTAEEDGQTGGRTVADGERTGADSGQTAPQPGQNAPQTGPEAVCQADSQSCFPQKAQLKTAENAEKAPKTWYFFGVCTFMMDYRAFLRELQRLMQQERRIWAHTLRVNQLRQLENLQAKARTHCREQGLAYETLLLSETLGACEAYLRGILSTVIVNPALLGMDSVRLTHDEELMGLIQRALSVDSFFVERGQGVGAA